MSSMRWITKSGARGFLAGKEYAKSAAKPVAPKALPSAAEAALSLTSYGTAGSRALKQNRLRNYLAAVEK